MAVATSTSPNIFRLAGSFFRSSIGAKMLMALTGLILWGFVIGHLLGNLQVLLPAPEGGYVGQQINEYAAFLKATPALLWGVRGLLLLSFLLHMYFGLRLAKNARKARGQRYERFKPRRTNLAALSMATTGVALLSFVIFHLAHFTFFWVTPEYATLTDQAGLHNVHGMVWSAFSSWWEVALYAVLMAGLFTHLFHGSVSLFQSLGIRSSAWTPIIHLVAKLLVVGILVGNVGIPLIIFISWRLHGG